MKSTSFLALIIFWLCSCQEYTAYYPISQPEETIIKSELIGKWQYVSAQNLDSMEWLEYGTHVLRVVPFNNKEFLAQTISDTLESLRDIDHFRGYITEIDEVKLANLSPIDEPHKRPVFSIYKYDLIGDSLIFWGIGLDRFKTMGVEINSMKEHKKFIQSTLSNPQTWNMEYKYVRMKDAKSR